MKFNILIIGKKSFIAKNFINDFGNLFELFYLDYYFYKNKNKNKYSNKLNNIIKQKKINVILNFAANNDNSLELNNFDKILESNLYLPLELLKAASKFKIALFLFLSKDMSVSNDKKNFYSLSKDMLKICIINNFSNCKLRLLKLYN